MLQLKFKVNKLYVLAHALSFKQSIVPFPSWRKLADRLWKLSPSAYQFLSGAYYEYFIANLTTDITNTKDLNSSIRNLNRETNSLIRLAYKSKEFDRLYNEVMNYKNWVANQWQIYEKEILFFITDIIGIKLPDVTLEVFVTHPKLKNGVFLGDNKIAWGHSEDWPNYSIVYLTHEIMHFLTQKDKSKTMHAIIELMTDNELRVRFNKKSKYFYEKGKWVGHTELKSLSKQILPYWKKYLKLSKSKKDIFDFARKMKKLFEIKKRTRKTSTGPLSRSTSDL